PSAIAPVLITSILDLLKSISPATNVTSAGAPDVIREPQVTAVKTCVLLISLVSVKTNCPAASEVPVNADVTTSARPVTVYSTVAPATGLSNASTRLTRTLFSSTPSATAPVLITTIIDQV